MELLRTLFGWSFILGYLGAAALPFCLIPFAFIHPARRQDQIFTYWWGGVSGTLIFVGVVGLLCTGGMGGGLCYVE